MLRSNPLFKLEKEVTINGITYSLYIPHNITDYHLSRHLEATRHAAYAGAGVTEEVLRAHCDAILELCEGANSFKDFRNDVVGITMALKYRTQYPVDQHAGVRMGAILSFMEYTDKDGNVVSEEPNKTEFVWLQLKERLAFQSDDLYAFFLSWGAANVRGWSDHSDTLRDQEYFLTRRKTLMGMIPSDLRSRLVP